MKSAVKIVALIVVSIALNGCVSPAFKPVDIEGKLIDSPNPMSQEYITGNMTYINNGGKALNIEDINKSQWYGRKTGSYGDNHFYFAPIDWEYGSDKREIKEISSYIIDISDGSYREGTDLDNKRISDDLYVNIIKWMAVKNRDQTKAGQVIDALELLTFAVGIKKADYTFYDEAIVRTKDGREIGRFSRVSHQSNNSYTGNAETTGFVCGIGDPKGKDFVPFTKGCPDEGARYVTSPDERYIYLEEGIVDMAGKDFISGPLVSQRWKNKNIFDAHYMIPPILQNFVILDKLDKVVFIFRDADKNLGFIVSDLKPILQGG